MKFLRFMLIAMAAGLLAVAASANPVSVTNPGFENPTLNPGGWVGSIPGWTMGPAVAGSVGEFYPGAAQYPGGIPEGNNVAFTKGASISQILTTTLQPNTVYALSVAGGYRLDNANLPFVGFTIWLMAGNTVIANASSGSQAPGTWSTVFASYTSGANDPLAGLALQILLTVNNPNGRQVNFDNVQLDATGAPRSQVPVSGVPEPGTIALVGTGLIGFLRRRFRG